MASIFISHITEDKPWLWGLCAKLKKLGHTVFIDKPEKVGLDSDRGIKIGRKWYHELHDKLHEVDYVLAIWSPNSIKKLKRKRGKIYAREIGWAALQEKLIFGIIDANKDATSITDEAFWRSTVGPDFSELLGLIRSDKIYGSNFDEISDCVVNGQYINIEGLRANNPIMASEEGILKLHRERLMPQTERLREFNYEDLVQAMSLIDRDRPIQRLEGILERPVSTEYAATTLQASQECQPEFVLQRLDAKVDEVPWRHFRYETKDDRCSDFIKRVEDVIAPIRNQVANGTNPKSRVIDCPFSNG